MNAGVKLIIGILIFLVGLYWYTVDYIPGAAGWTTIIGKKAVDLFIDVFVGTFGLFLIIFGLLVAWVEYEDLKWGMEEKKQRTKTKRRKKRK